MDPVIGPRREEPLPRREDREQGRREEDRWEDPVMADGAADRQAASAMAARAADRVIRQGPEEVPEAAGIRDPGEARAGAQDLEEVPAQEVRVRAAAAPGPEEAAPEADRQAAEADLEAEEAAEAEPEEESKGPKQKVG